MCWAKMTAATEGRTLVIFMSDVMCNTGMYRGHLRLSPEIFLLLLLRKGGASGLDSDSYTTIDHSSTFDPLNFPCRQS